MSETLLEAKGVSVAYWRRGRRRPVLQDVSFTLAEGGTLGVIGESGAGKTTLLRALAGLARISSGRVLWQGRSIGAASARARWRSGMRVGLVFQDPHASLDPRQRIWRIVTEQAYINGQRNTARLRDLAGELLARVNLAPELLDRFPHALSGGQRQRVAIARALCGDPGLLLLDEPTSALDVTVQVQILELLRSLKSSGNLSIIMISHDLHAVRAICSDALVLLNGRVVERGTTSAIFAHPQADYTRQLVAATPTLD